MAEELNPDPPRANPGVPFLVFLFSLVPGAGHMYQGLMKKGTQIMVFFFGTLFLFEVVGGPFTELWGIVIAPVTWFYSLFDSLQTSSRLRQGEPVKDEGPFAADSIGNYSTIWGWVLIGLGVLTLLRSLDLLRRIPDTVGPVLIIAAGVWVLWRAYRSREG